MLDLSFAIDLKPHTMYHFHHFPIGFILVRLAIIIVICYWVYKSVKRSISLKQDQNDLLREILKKLESK
jgi:hypothetical protein